MDNLTVSSAKALLNEKDYGILSTLSLKLGGFPFGSITPYCLDGYGKPIIYISTIAEHTKNIINDNRCSITVVSNSEDIQAGGRLCIIGHMELLSPEEMEVSSRYFRHFPKSKGYSHTHNFSFYRLNPTAIRYIGGFGAIHWLDPIQFISPNPFHGNEELAIIEHMNEDHMQDLVNYCKYYKNVAVADKDAVKMVGIDSCGFDVFVNNKKIRFELEQPMTNVKEARAALVALSRGMTL